MRADHARMAEYGGRRQLGRCWGSWRLAPRSDSVAKGVAYLLSERVAGWSWERAAVQRTTGTAGFRGVLFEVPHYRIIFRFWL